MSSLSVGLCFPSCAAPAEIASLLSPSWPEVVSCIKCVKCVSWLSCVLANCVFWHIVFQVFCMLCILANRVFWIQIMQPVYLSIFLCIKIDRIQRVCKPVLLIVCSVCRVLCVFQIQIMRPCTSLCFYILGLVAFNVWCLSMQGSRVLPTQCRIFLCCTSWDSISTISLVAGGGEFYKMCQLCILAIVYSVYSVSCVSCVVHVWSFSSLEDMSM